MSQRIHTGGGSQPFRHAFHQGGVVNGQHWRHMFVDNRHFDMTRHVGDDAETGHFRRRTRGSVNRDHRQLRFCRAVNAFVITDIAAVGCHQRDPFRAVVRGTTAQGDDAIAIIGAQHFQTFFNVNRRWVRMGTIKYHAQNVEFLQTFLDIARDT